MTENKTKHIQKRTIITEARFVIPYIESVSERVDRVLKKYEVDTAIRPHTTLIRLLMHPKDKVEPEEQGELVY